MTRATASLRNFAGRLIAYETRSKPFFRNKLPAAFPVYAKLHPQLATLMGNTGVRALLLRALARAEKDVPALRAIQVNVDGQLAMSDKFAARNDPEQLGKGSVFLIAHLLDMLIAFIGETLTLHLVSEVWPKVPLDDLEFGGARDEKAK